jgi:hypothetical protein
MTLEEQVFEIRRSFETGTISEAVLIDLYKEYSDIEDIALFVHRAKESFPMGNCGLASLYLKKVLGTGEIVQGMYENQPHTFLLVDNQIIDITADQYGGPKIYMGPLIAPWSK